MIAYALRWLDALVFTGSIPFVLSFCKILIALALAYGNPAFWYHHVCSSGVGGD